MAIAAELGSATRLHQRPQCVDCGRVSWENERGWRAYLTVDEDELAVAVVYCPRCAVKELGR